MMLTCPREQEGIRVRRVRLMFSIVAISGVCSYETALTVLVLSEELSLSDRSCIACAAFCCATTSRA